MKLLTVDVIMLGYVKILCVPAHQCFCFFSIVCNTSTYFIAFSAMD